jgi:hypothetical protein
MEKWLTNRISTKIEKGEHRWPLVASNGEEVGASVTFSLALYRDQVNRQ